MGESQNLHHTCWFLWWITLWKFKIYSQKPKIESMYLIRLIKENFSKTLLRRFQGLIVGRKRGGSLRWHPSSSFSFLLIGLRRHQKITPSTVFTRTRNPKQYGLLEPFVITQHKFLSTYFYFHKKRWSKKKEKNGSTKVSHFLSPTQTLKIKMYIYIDILSRVS